MKKKISWDRQAVTYFREAIRYIRKDSPKNAEKVKNAILAKIDDVSQHPESYPPDKYKLNNGGNYRAFELYNLRVGCLVKEDEIVIARIRSVKQEPLDY